MPDNIDIEGEILLVDESNADTSSVTLGEDTPTASNNEGETSDDSSKKSSEKDPEALQRERNTTYLGTVAKRAVEFNLKRALDGDSEAKEFLLDNAQNESYLKSKFKDEYNQLLSGEEVTDEQKYISKAKQELKKELAQEKLSEKLISEIGKTIKGEEDKKRAIDYAMRLIDAGANEEDALNGAINTVRRVPESQPMATRIVSSTNSRPDEVTMSKTAYEMAKGFGMTDESIKRQVNKYSKFFDPSSSNSLAIKNGEVIDYSTDFTKVKFRSF